jgi:hypothetical protein
MISFNPIDISLNISTNELQPTPNVGKTVFFSIICFLTVIGNGLIILLVKVEPRLRSVSNYFIINLAIADAGLGLMVQPFLSILEINNNFWPYDDVLCDLWISFDYLFSSSSFLSMFAISFDRYWSLVLETKLDMNKNLSRSRRRAFILILLTWTIPLTIWVPSVYANRRIYGPSLNNNCSHRVNSVFISICYMIFYYIPMIMMLFFYVKIFRMLNSQINKLSIWLTEIDLEIFRNLSSSNMSSEVITSMSLLSNVNFQCLNKMNNNKNNNQKINKETIGSTPILLRKNTKIKKSKSKPHLTTLFKFGNETNERNHNSFRNISLKQSSTSIGARSSSFDLFNGIKKLTSFKIRNSKKDKNKNSEANASNSTVRLLNSNKRQLKYSNSNSNILNENNPGLYLKRHSSYQPETYQKTNTLYTPLPCLNPINNCNLMRKVNSSSGQHQQKLRLIKQQRVSKMIGVLIFVFLICWVPFSIVTPIQVFCENCISKRLFYNIIWCKYLNSTVNPLLYMLTNKVSRLLELID